MKRAKQRTQKAQHQNEKQENLLRRRPNEKQKKNK
jgi:hypothetical protein